MSLPEQLESLAREAQTETQALREIIRQKDEIIAALKAHSICIRQNFKATIGLILDLTEGNESVKKYAEDIIKTLDKVDA